MPRCVATTMNFEVVLRHDELGEQGSVVVDEIYFKEIGEGFYVKLTGTDPYCYPEWVQEPAETRRWFSKNLTLMLHVDDPVAVDDVAVTGKQIPKPDPAY